MPTRGSGSATASFNRAVARIEPVAETMCRQRYTNARRSQCDFAFRISQDPRLGENAFQSIGPDGRPRVTFTLSLLRALGNDDEVAFILGHEAAHHIEGHLARSATRSQLGALLLGGLVAASGNASDQAVRDAAGLGAELGRRSYSKNAELEADRLAVDITARSGYNPVRGAAPFNRIETGSSGFLSTHPPSSERYRAILRRVRELGL
ncbi:M48 family metallopeptidase [Halovulum sp. GXIMD14793]